MGVNIDTAHSVPGMFSAYMNGFTSGNTTGGLAATEVSANWFNSVQQEINTVINQSGFDPTGIILNPNDFGQLANAIDYRFAVEEPRAAYSGGIYTWRTLLDSDMLGYRSCNVTRRTTINQVASGSVTNCCTLIPGGSAQMMITYKVAVLQTDLTTNYGNAVWYASARSSTVQNSAASYSDISLAGLAFSVVVSGASIALRVTIPAAPAGKLFNVWVFGEGLRCSSIFT